MDFSRGLSLHRLYGHVEFAVEAHKKNKDQRFQTNICRELGCTPDKRYEPGRQTANAWR